MVSRPGRSVDCVHRGKNGGGVGRRSGIDENGWMVGC